MRIRYNYKDLPPCAKDKFRVGQKVVCQKGHVVFTKWYDKKVGPFADDIVVTRLDNEVPKPSVIDLHNQHMEGVNRANQMHEYYSTG